MTGDASNDNEGGPAVAAWLDAGKKHAPHLSPATLAALLAVASQDGPTVHTVANTLEVEPQTAQRLVGLLVEPEVGDPLVERVEESGADNDRFYLTDAGFDLADRLADSAGLV